VALYRDQGIVLRSWKVGEADRIINVMTRGNGKVRAIAKGVRKTRSKFGSRLEPTSHGSFQFYEGRGDLDIVTQVESVETLQRLRTDLDRFARASAMLEAVDQLAPERDQNYRLFDMLAGALRTLDANDSPLVVAGFYWKALSLEGFEPHVDACVECGAEEPLVAFDMEAGGVLCEDCRRGRPISGRAVELMQLILGGRLHQALEEPTGAETFEVDRLATAAMEHHLERRIRSIGVLDDAR
jgi:DNA repair protein RecO (recombination protein O)